MRRQLRFFLLVLSLVLGLTSRASAGKSQKNENQGPTFFPGSTAGTVHALFDLRTPATGPFPSDRFTVADSSHNTRQRVNLPMPDCVVRPSDCEDLAVINTLDGFNADPRLSIPFDGPIDVKTVTSETVFLVSLDSTSCDGDDNCDDDGNHGSRVIGINQVVWDPATNTLHVESNEFLYQHSRYGLIVTRGVLDQFGQPVEATEAFRRFRQEVGGDYKKALLKAIKAARAAGVPERDIVAASAFTTQTVTSILEKIRDQIKAATPEPADFLLGPGGIRTVFPLDTVAGITWNQQTGDDPPTFTNAPVDLSLLKIIPGAVGTIAFGKYNSPDYEVHPGEFIPPVGTRTGTPAVQGTNEIYFNLVLPSGTKPATGWPVAIFGHANGVNKNAVLNVAAKMAAHGIATIAINAVGAGVGQLGTLTVNRTSGETVTFSAGGRGIDQNGDRVIDSDEGISTAPPRTILFFTDGIRQTVADLMQLVRVIDVGVDVDGDGSPDLDKFRIYYFGNSLGSNIGTVEHSRSEIDHDREALSRFIRPRMMSPRHSIDPFAGQHRSVKKNISMPLFGRNRPKRRDTAPDHIFLLMLLLVVEREASSAEGLIAKAAMLGVCIAHGSSRMIFCLFQSRE